MGTVLFIGFGIYCGWLGWMVRDHQFDVWEQKMWDRGCRHMVEGVSHDGEE